MQIIPEPELTVDLIGERHRRLLTVLRAAAQAGGHDPDRLRIVAVTKSWPVEVCRAAMAAGLTMLGENRVQEAEPKVAAIPEAEWHFVGRLQSNKARRAVRGFAVLHSVDSIELLARLEAVAAEEGRRLRILLQVDWTGEEARAGFDARWFEDAADQPGSDLVGTLQRLHALEPSGLMTMARLGADEAEARATFAGLRRLRDRLRESSGLPLPELSMGMSADANAAAAEGATLVRIGQALFGPRPA